MNSCNSLDLRDSCSFYPGGSSHERKTKTSPGPSSGMDRQIELLTEQIRIMDQRFFGRRSESAVSDIDGQISLFDSFNETEYLDQEPSKEPEITEVIIPSYHRKKDVGKRESDLSGLQFPDGTSGV